MDTGGQHRAVWSHTEDAEFVCRSPTGQHADEGAIGQLAGNAERRHRRNAQAGAGTLNQHMRRVEERRGAIHAYRATRQGGGGPDFAEDATM